MSLVHIYQGARFVPHDRTTTQSALIYSTSSTSFIVPLGAWGARIVPINGVSILAETGDIQNGTASNCDAGSTVLPGGGLEYIVPVAKNGSTLKLAGLTNTATFQLSWIF